MDLLNILLMPVIIGIIMLIIEYAVIQPIKESSSAIGALSFILKTSTVLIAITLISINILFLIDNSSITTIFNNYSSISISIPIDSTLNLISDANISLASIIYSLIALLLVSKNNKHIFSFISNFIPSTLLTIWLIIFIVKENFILLNILIILSYLWTIGRIKTKNRHIALILVVIAQPIYSAYLISSNYTSPQTMAIISILIWSLLSPLSRFLSFGLEYTSADIMDLIMSLGTILIICCWPINALLLINYQLMSAIWAWIIAAIFGIIQFFVTALAIYD